MTLAMDELFADATNPDHPYHSNPQIALKLLAEATEMLQSTDYSDPSILKLAVIYIHLEYAGNSGTSLTSKGNSCI